MATISSAVHDAADTLQQIAETTPGERGRRAAAVALVLRSARARWEGEPGSGFLHRRAEREAAEVPGAAERALLHRLLSLSGPGPEGSWGELARALVGYAHELETTRRLPEAEAVLSLARTLTPGCAELALHAGRVARLAGDRERALSLYREARGLDTGGGAIARLAAVGEAVVSERPEAGLGRALRRAVRSGDAEAAAVALEERARLRRARGERAGAVRDLCIAAARFTDPVDRARVAHLLADLCVAGDDLRGAREALLAALELGDGSQKDHARARLHTVARDLGDQVGMRRWRSFSRPALVSLSGRARTAGGASAAPRLARWRERIGEAER